MARPETPSLPRGFNKAFSFFLNLYLNQVFIGVWLPYSIYKACYFRCAESGSVMHIHISAHFCFQTLRNYRALSRVSCATQLALTSHLFHLQKSVSVSPGSPSCGPSPRLSLVNVFVRCIRDSAFASANIPRFGFFKLGYNRYSCCVSFCCTAK